MEKKKENKQGTEKKRKNFIFIYFIFAATLYEFLFPLCKTETESKSGKFPDTRQKGNSDSDLSDSRANTVSGICSPETCFQEQFLGT